MKLLLTADNDYLDVYISSTKVHNFPSRHDLETTYLFYNLGIDIEDLVILRTSNSYVLRNLLDLVLRLLVKKRGSDLLEKG